tara:strand:- start:273 stop:530 length:258 start_codon:yes stop_codon:yes gene_type:complete
MKKSIYARQENVNSPNHYTDGGIETIDYIKAKIPVQSFKDGCRWHILKYASRAGKKEGNSEIQDVQKLIVFAKYWEKAILDSEPS